MEIQRLGRGPKVHWNLLAVAMSVLVFSGCSSPFTKSKLPVVPTDCSGATQFVQYASMCPSPKDRKAVLAQAIAMCPDADAPHFWTALTLEQEVRQEKKPDYQGAMGELQATIRINPSHVGALFKLGALEYVSGHFAEAEPYFLRVVALTSGNAHLVETKKAANSLSIRTRWLRELPAEKIPPKVLQGDPALWVGFKVLLEDAARELGQSAAAVKGNLGYAHGGAATQKIVEKPGEWFSYEGRSTARIRDALEMHSWSVAYKEATMSLPRIMADKGITSPGVYLRLMTLCKSDATCECMPFCEGAVDLVRHGIGTDSAAVTFGLQARRVQKCRRGVQGVQELIGTLREGLAGLDAEHNSKDWRWILEMSATLIDYLQIEPTGNELPEVYALLSRATHTLLEVEVSQMVEDDLVSDQRLARAWVGWAQCASVEDMEDNELDWLSDKITRMGKHAQHQCLIGAVAAAAIVDARKGEPIDLKRSAMLLKLRPAPGFYSDMCGRSSIPCGRVIETCLQTAPTSRRDTRRTPEGATAATPLAGNTAALEPTVALVAPPLQQPTTAASTVRATEGASSSENLAESTQVFAVQVASYRTLEQANQDLANLRKHGFEGKVARTDLGSKGIWYRVYVGGYTTKEAASAARDAIVKLPGYGALPQVRQIAVR